MLSSFAQITQFELFWSQLFNGHSQKKVTQVTPYTSISPMTETLHYDKRPIGALNDQAQNVCLNVTVTENLHLRCNHNLLCCTLELHIHLAKKKKKNQHSGQCKSKMILSLPLSEICMQFPFQLGSFILFFKITVFVLMQLVQYSPIPNIICLSVFLHEFLSVVYFLFFFISWQFFFP